MSKTAPPKRTAPGKDLARVPAGELAGNVKLGDTMSPTAHMTPLPDEKKSVPVSAVAFSKEINPRRQITPTSVASLKQSMAKHGLLQPIVVSEQSRGGSYTILAGRRRLTAAMLLGWERIDANVITGGLARRLEIMLTENAQREDADPLLEAEVIGQMLARKGWGLVDVAATLGRSQEWVARRHALSNLSPKVTKAIRDNVERGSAPWPITWLEEIALVGHAQQEQIYDYEVLDFGQLRRDVKEAMKSLGAAAWPLEDAQLTKAGACTTCPKHTAAVPSLFPEEPKLHVLKTALCRDDACYSDKASAWVKHVRDELKRTSGKPVLQIHGARILDDGYAKDADKGKDAPLPIGDYAKAKPKDKGAVQAVVVDGPNAGTTTWVKKEKSREAMSITGRNDTRKSAPKSASLAERKKALELRRKRHVFQEFRAELEEIRKNGIDELVTRSNADEIVLQLVAAFGTDHKGGWAWNDRGNVKRGAAVAGGPKAVRRRVLEDLLDAALGRQGCFEVHRGTGNSANDVFNDVAAWTEILEWTGVLGMPTRVKAAAEALPDPKGWEALGAKKGKTVTVVKVKGKRTNAAAVAVLERSVKKLTRMAAAARKGAK